MAIAYIGIGSNLGDRLAHIQAALDRLRSAPGVTGVQASSSYETQPVGGPPGQGQFLNAAARVETTLLPAELLALLQRVETELGRVRSERWGPRTIDLDLLLYDDLVLDTPELTLPHPRMLERRFVLEPLAEIAPDAIHPGLKSPIRGLLGKRIHEASYNKALTHEIRFVATAREQMRQLTARDRAIIYDGAKRYLVCEPAIENKRRKRMRPNPLAPWELRLGDLRVFYDVIEQPQAVVNVLAVGTKRGNKLLIDGKEYPNEAS